LESGQGRESCEDVHSGMDDPETVRSVEFKRKSQADVRKRRAESVDEEGEGVCEAAWCGWIWGEGDGVRSGAGEAEV
jgi:hypothetical protein